MVWATRIVVPGLTVDDVIKIIARGLPKSCIERFLGALGMFGDRFSFGFASFFPKPAFE